MQLSVMPGNYIIGIAAIGLLFAGLIHVQTNLLLATLFGGVGLIIIVYYIVTNKVLTLYTIKQKKKHK